MEREYFVEAWKNDLSGLNASQQFWDLRADDFNNRHREKDEYEKEPVMEYLQSLSTLPGEEVLDIGCGPGHYSSRFAALSGHVTGIDISPNMLAYAQENARQQRLNNVVFELSPWETLDLDERGWSGKFDLVFASMCPGISSGDSLLKMCRASRKACFLSTFAERQDELRDQLYRLVYGKEPEKRWGKNIYYTFNILWLSGYYPEVTYYDRELEHRWPLGKAVELYCRQLEGVSREEQNPGRMEEVIDDYLRSIAVDGFVSEKNQSKIAWLYWKV